MRILFVLMTFCALSCADSSGGGLNATQGTSIPFLFNGEDSGFKLLVHLANYSRKVQPVFGPEGDAEISEEGEILTLRFHPKNEYSDTGGHGAANQYFLYVGLLAPPMSEKEDGTILEGGMPERMDVKDKQVNFTGEFRFESGNAEVRKSLFLTPTYMYFKHEPFEYKQIAFNNHGGLEDHAAEDLYFDLVEFGHSSGWYNVYWGDWWDDQICVPDPDDSQVASQWISFDVDLSAASERALDFANEEFQDQEPGDDHFNTDSVELWGAYLGPESQIGKGELVFSVRNLNLNFSQ
jgi:hypothetical protein